jgi:hypothetical protein
VSVGGSIGVGSFVSVIVASVVIVAVSGSGWSSGDRVAVWVSVPVVAGVDVRVGVAEGARVGGRCVRVLVGVTVPVSDGCIVGVTVGVGLAMSVIPVKELANSHNPFSVPG